MRAALFPLDNRGSSESLDADILWKFTAYSGPLHQAADGKIL